MQCLPETDGIVGVRIGLERSFSDEEPSRYENLILTQICDTRSAVAWEEIFAKLGRGTVVHYAGNGVTTLDPASGEPVRDLIGLWVGIDAGDAVRLVGEPRRAQ